MFEIFSKVFHNTPHLYKGIQLAFEQLKTPQFTNCLRLTPPLYLPFRKVIFASKNSIPIHFIRDFARGIMRTKLQSPSLNSHENGVLAGCFFKNSKYVYNLTSHLVAIENAKTKRGWQNFSLFNSLGNGQIRSLNFNSL